MGEVSPFACFEPPGGGAQGGDLAASPPGSRVFGFERASSARLEMPSACSLAERPERQGSLGAALQRQQLNEQQPSRLRLSITTTRSLRVGGTQREGRVSRVPRIQEDSELAASSSGGCGHHGGGGGCLSELHLGSTAPSECDCMALTRASSSSIEVPARWVLGGSLAVAVSSWLGLGRAPQHQLGGKPVGPASSSSAASPRRSCHHLTKPLRARLDPPGPGVALRRHTRVQGLAAAHSRLPRASPAARRLAKAQTAPEGLPDSLVLAATTAGYSHGRSGPHSPAAAAAVVGTPPGQRPLLSSPQHPQQQLLQPQREQPLPPPLMLVPHRSGSGSDTPGRPPMPVTPGFAPARSGSGNNTNPPHGFGGGAYRSGSGGSSNSRQERGTPPQRQGSASYRDLFDAHVRPSAVLVPCCATVACHAALPSCQQ